jgi:hypothetical protein
MRHHFQVPPDTTSQDESKMTETKTYNGWTNYETWNVNLWIDNEQGSYNYWREVAQETWDAAEADGTFSREERAVFDLSERLKSETEDGAPDLGASMWSDLLSAALSEVNWREIAEHMIEGVDRTADELDELDEIDDDE